MAAAGCVPPVRAETQRGIVSCKAMLGAKIMEITFESLELQKRNRLNHFEPFSFLKVSYVVCEAPALQSFSSPEERQPVDGWEVLLPHLPRARHQRKCHGLTVQMCLVVLELLAQAVGFCRCVMP